MTRHRMAIVAICASAALLSGCVGSSTDALNVSGAVAPGTVQNPSIANSAGQTALVDTPASNLATSRPMEDNELAPVAFAPPTQNEPTAFATVPPAPAASNLPKRPPAQPTGRLQVNGAYPNMSEIPQGQTNQLGKEEASSIRQDMMRAQRVADAKATKDAVPLYKRTLQEMKSLIARQRKKGEDQKSF